MATAGPIEISGAGPAGIAAGLSVVQAGRDAVVYEARADVGGRFHGDFQGLENWTSATDVLEELAGLGIEPSFDTVPVREALFFGPDGREHPYRSSRPVLYLVRRGKASGTLDAALKEQALTRGVEFRFNQRKTQLPRGGIVAHGPGRPNVIAVGYVFETASVDGTFAAFSDALAPKGYAYLLIHRGAGTIASCMFDRFQEEKACLERTVDFFRRKVGFEMREPHRFGGLGSFRWADTARQGAVVFAGEAAGFLDALWGFGLRYALVSGWLAGRSLAAGSPESYDAVWKRRLGGLLRTSLVNRYLYDRIGSAGYERLLRGLDRSREVRDWLRRQYAPRTWKRLLEPLARRSMRVEDESPDRGAEPFTAD